MIQKDKYEPLKQEIVVKTEEIISLKTQLHHLKTYTTLGVISLLMISSIAVLYLNKQVTEEMTSRLLIEKQLENSNLASKQLEKVIVQKDKKYQELVSDSSLVYVSKEDLLNDLTKYYPDVSTKTKIAILETILSESEKYGMNPLILYSMCHTESSFRHWLEHEPVMITQDNKKIKIRAVGLMGVVWEIHKDDIKNIVGTRGDLFDPVNNIKAGAYILAKYREMPLLKGSKSSIESALLRYYGGNFQSYVSRVQSKILQITTNAILG